MNFNFLKKFIIGSSFHGIELVFKSRHHLIERLLWIFLIAISIYFASNTCNKEWQRFQNNSVVLSLETNHRSWEYIVPGFTICTDFIDQERADDFIEKTWSISKNDSKFVVYKKFVEVVTRTTYENLHEFDQFSNYTFLNRLDMLQIAREMREYLLPDASFHLVVTELGVCFSTSYLHLLQQVSEKNVSIISDTDGEFCRSTLSSESCNLEVRPPIELDENDDYNQTVYIHNKENVLSPAKSISMKFYYETVTKIELIINAIVSSNKLKQLIPSQRKCYFEDEISLKYFNVYTTNLCLISCRIDAAIKLCECVPFFYRINTFDYPDCNIRGMVCLSKNWFDEISNSSSPFDKECNCLPLCTDYEYKRAVINSQSYPGLLSTAMEISIVFPKTRLKRGVVYSADNLLVAFGGVFGLCLGCSFISFVEFLFFFLEIFVEIIMSQILKLKLHA